MDSEDEFGYDEEEDVDDESSENEDFVEMAEPSSTQDRLEQDDFPFEVLTADQIVMFMVECIREVNVVIEVCKKT